MGGEIYYDFLGATLSGQQQYRITLKLYRDCNGNTADFDYGALLTVIGGGNEIIVNIGNPTVTQVPPTLNTPCDQVPYLCLEEGIYTGTITVNPVSGGYYVIYQRCCRNNSISNIVQPGLQGTTCYAWIPGPEIAQHNSSPRFTNFPPIFLCKGVPIFFDHVATDPDGDYLEYSLGSPYNGLDGCCPILQTFPAGSSSACPSPPNSCPLKAPPPPYDSIQFSNGYSYSQPLGNASSLSIDKFSGMLTGQPNVLGQFVVCVVVREFKNGVLISTHYRDFQFNIVPCIIPVRADMADQPKKCMGSTFTFTNHSISTTGGVTYKWDFGVEGISSDTSVLANPTYQYPDTGMYIVTLIGNPGKTCTDTIQKKVYIYPKVQLSFPHQKPQCIKNNLFDFQAACNYSLTGKFSWDLTSKASPSVSPHLHAPNIRFLEAGLHMVKVYAKQFDCVDSFADSVRIIARPTASIMTLPQGMCKPAVINFSNTSTSEDPLTYFWKFSDDSTTTEINPRKIFVNEGIYGASLTIISDGICKDTSMVSISDFSVFPVPASRFTVTPKSTTVLEPTILVKSTRLSGITCEYDFGDGSLWQGNDPHHSYFEPGRYVITEIIRNSFGCSDTAIDIIKVLPEHRFWIPNAFTPDGNDINDRFRPVLAGVVNYRFEIFDRWGHLIFSTSEVQEGWDGKYLGKVCQNGVYIWKVSYKDVVEEVTHQQEGHLVLVAQE